MYFVAFMGILPTELGRVVIVEWVRPATVLLRVVLVQARDNQRCHFISIHVYMHVYCSSERDRRDRWRLYSPLAAATSIGTAIAGFLRPKGHITLRRIEEAKRAPNALFAKKKAVLHTCRVSSNHRRDEAAATAAVTRVSGLTRQKRAVHL
ncbi:hypothetical protein BC826DRAFT_57844 [Russula brevipes]|nr:hypothetical protein BC826DRAFT_57844 [Russula brevipes]